VAHLPVLGRDRRGVDDDAALAVVERVFFKLFFTAYSLVH